MIQELAGRFRAENGSIICRELLGLARPEGTPQAEARTPEYYKKPAGEHTITFEYKPASYYEGAVISRICTGILLLLLGIAFVLTIKKRREEVAQR